MNNIYRLDRFLSIGFMKQLVTSNGFEIVNNPENVEELLNYYKETLERVSSSPFIVTEETQFTQKIQVHEDEYYYVSWSIPKAEHIVSQHKISPTILTTNQMEAAIQQHRNRSKPDTSIDNSVPIMAVHYPPIPMKYLIIAGIQQAINQVEKGHKYMEVIVLETNVHPNAMVREIDRRLFFVHFNYSLICSYLAGHITSEQLSARMFPVY